MSPASRALIDRPARTGRVSDSHDDLTEMQLLRADLERMRLYALALEDRCHRLWAGIPDSDGDRDPMVPYLALHCSMVAPAPVEPD